MSKIENTQEQTNREIAKLLGYSYERETSVGEIDVYRLYDSQGEIRATVTTRVGNPWDALLAQASKYGYLPLWSFDLEGAMRLMRGTETNLKLEISPEGFCRATIWDRSGDYVAYSQTDDVMLVFQACAHCVAEAWAQWKQAQVAMLAQ